jgi:hypothetical protein
LLCEETTSHTLTLKKKFPLQAKPVPTIITLQFPQKYFQKVTFSQRSKSTMQLTTIHHTKTTNSPQETIQKNITSLSTPSKNTPKSSKIHPVSHPRHLTIFFAEKQV